MDSEKRIEGIVKRGEAFQITVDGKPMLAYPGETIAAVLFAAGERLLRRTVKQNKPRSVFCGIGICYDCLVTVNGVPNQRACTTLAQPGSMVTRQWGVTSKEMSRE